MSDRVLTAEARITATDATGSVFANIAKKIDAIGKGAKISPQIDAMAKSLERAEKQMKALDAVQGQRGSFSAARAKFNETQKAVEQAARAMKSAEAPSRQLAASYEKAQRAVSAASKAFEQQRAAMVSAIRTAESFGAPIGKIAAEQTRLRGVIASTTAAIERQTVAERMAVKVQEQHGRAMRTGGAGAAAGRVGRGGHGGDGTLAGLAGMYVSHEVGHLAHSVIERFAEFDRERRYGKVVMGLSDADQEPLIRQAIRGGASSRFNDIQWLESQRELAARGYSRDQVMAFTPIAAQLGQAFDVGMPEGVKGLEGGLLGFKKDTSSYAAAMASAQRTADLQVKASKISGMGFEDITQLYKYASAPALMAHLSEEQMLAFGAISKKSNMGGDESGVAFRALAKNLITPTAGAQLAMRAAGINFNSFQSMPDHLDTQGFVEAVAKNYGVALDGKAQGALRKIFTNKALIGNATAFMPAVREVLGDVLGGDDAKSKNKIAGLARNYRDASVQSVDTNGLMTSLMTAMSKSPALANAVFGSKQGGRIFAALGDPKFYGHILDELQHQSQGFAGRVSDARTEGFSGALQRLSGTIANVETAIGRSLDNGGKGGMLTHGTEGLAAALNAFTEAGPAVHQLVAAGGAAAGAWGSLKGLQFLGGGFGLKGSAVALDHAAGHLEVAAARLGGGGGLPGGGSGSGGHGPGRSPSKSLLPRAIGALVTAAPMLMQAYDDVANPEGRQERYNAQAEQAKVDREWWGDKVRKARDAVGLKKLLPFSDDNAMPDNEQGPRLPGRLIEEDPILRRLRQGLFLHRPRAYVPGVHILEGVPDDPWLSGERQAIDRRSLIAADHFRRDPEAARGEAMMRSQGPLDVNVKTDGKTVVVVEPSPLLLAKIAFQGQNTQVSTGSGAPSIGVTGSDAGKAPHIGRGDL